jgi:hypothetical protein
VRALDLQDPAAVRETLLAGAGANRSAACRRRSIDVIEAPGTLIATGDLHDNPLHLVRLVRAAGMEESGDGVIRRQSDAAESGGDLDDSSPSLRHSFTSSGATHLVLHEIIHSDKLIGGMDFSFRALVRVAALKSEFPERAHVLLANHELAQLTGPQILKEGVKVVELFNQGVEYMFGEDAPGVQEAIGEFIRSLPLALRCVCPPPFGDILVAHSLPGAALMERFDPTVLSRDLTPEDYEPRKGAAHLMVWGRSYDAEQIEDLVERWGVNLIILGHEKADRGVKFVPPCVVVLNSDHENGVYLPIDLSHPPRAEEAVGRVVRLAQL